ncbi:MAG TPA: hypothetical protein VFS20_12510, partial [Longimicrobium sp.]|nr:hypothetical protein [Longimicrobium sp.]
APLSAQQHQHGHGQQAAAQHAQTIPAHYVTHAALEHRQELGLNADQVQRLTAVDSAHTRAMREHCSRMEAAGGHTAQNHDAMHQEMKTRMERHGQEAIAILTAAQKAQLDSLYAAHHGAGGQHGNHAMHGAAAGHGNHAAHGSTAAAGQGQGHAAHHGAGQASAQGAPHAGHGNASAHDCAECCKQMGGHAGHTTGG